MKLTTEQEAWLQALESGKYDQITAYLHDEIGYCCLGVACELLAEVCEVDVHFSRMEGLYIYAGYTNSLPFEVQNKLHLRNSEGRLTKPYKGAFSLTELNDRKRLSFKEIAAYIRANPENVFIKGAEDE